MAGSGRRTSRPDPRPRSRGAADRRCRRRSASRKTRRLPEPQQEQGGLDRSGAVTAGFRCECWRIDCSVRIPVSRREWQEVRSRAERFVVGPGNTAIEVQPGVEDVVKKIEHFWIVEKRGKAGDVAENGNRRSRREDRDGRVKESCGPQIPGPRGREGGKEAYPRESAHAQVQRQRSRRAGRSVELAIAELLALLIDRRGSEVRLRGVEPPRPVRVTRPSTLRVYQFRHRREGRR